MLVLMVQNFKTTEILSMKEDKETGLMVIGYAVNCHFIIYSDRLNNQIWCLH